MPRPANTGAGTVVHRDWAKNNRPAASNVLEDRCTIRRPGAPATPFDPATGSVGGPALVTVASDVACRISYGTPTTRRRDFAQEQVAARDYLVQLPWDHTDITEDDLLTVTRSGDPDLSGRVLRVVEVGAVTHMWSRVLRCEHTD